MNQDHKPTILPMRIMRPGAPPKETAGRLLIRHAIHGFMIGEVVEIKGKSCVITCGIDTSPSRNPVAVIFREGEDEWEHFIEWAPLDISVKPADRARAH